jgi:hypothetical protein
MNSSAAVCIVHQTARLKASQQHIPKVLKSIKALIQIITLSLFHAFRSGHRLGQLGLRNQCGSERCASARASAALDPAAELKEHRKDFCAGLPLAPAVLTISTWSASANSLDYPSCTRRAAMDLSWSRMCGEATKIGDRR